MSTTKSRQNVPYRRTLDVSDFVIDGNTVLKLSHIVRKSRNGEMKGSLPRIHSLDLAILIGAERLVSDYEKDNGEIIIAPSGLSCVNLPAPLKAKAKK